jgi:hypothetical protein
VTLVAVETTLSFKRVWAGGHSISKWMSPIDQWQGAGQTGGFVGLFQFNIVIPAGLSGDALLSVSVNGVPVQQVLYLTTGQ